MLLPRMVGGARVLERLGEGGMAVVHRAVDPFRPDRPMAVKFLRPEAGSDPDVVRRFLREGEVLKGLRHAHLVEVHDFGRAGSTPFLLMELLPGGSVKRCTGEAPSRLLRRFLPVMEAMDMAHAAGVIHRDLKPSNLLFAEDGRLKVTDFGVCLWEGGEGTRVTKSQMVVGTVGYMAPEQHGDPRRVDARCDVYALAAILYEFTTGQSYSQVLLPPAAVRPGFPPGLAAILMRALAADPGRRTPN
ncbi:MAG TPA: serine/threonine-protein kinase, partial [Holophaga sp.]|nr:serine/threonine-protein kinase [Holophaga sp.]